MNKIINTFKDKELLKKIGFSLSLILIFRIAAAITVPGINPKALNSLQLSGSMDLLDLLTGGGVKSLSIVALGVMPYITAQIVVQIIQSIDGTKINENSKQGDFGRKKNRKIALIASFPLALLQGVSMLVGLNKMSLQPYLLGSVHNTPAILLNATFIAFIMAIFSTALSYYAEYITDHGISNGPSLIIMISILVKAPSALIFTFKRMVTNGTAEQYAQFIFVLFIIATLTFIIVYLQKSIYYIKLNFLSNPNASKDTGNNLPLLLNGAGVIPVIFASSIFSSAQIIEQFVNKKTWFTPYVSFLDYRGIAVYGILVIIFTYFYSTIQQNPEDMADNLQTRNIIIPNVNPGQDTENYIKNKIYALDLPGSFYLMILAIIPMIITLLTSTPQSLVLIGTSLLIITNVLLEIVDKLGNANIKNNYLGLY